MFKIVKFSCNIILLLLFAFHSCKKNEKQKVINRDDNKVVNELKPKNQKKDSFPEVIKEKSIQINKPVIYSYLDQETDDFQELIIHWLDNNNFKFEIRVDNELCEYKDKGLAYLTQNSFYNVKGHPVLKKIIFNQDKTSLSLVCEYGAIRDECDPIQEVIHKKKQLKKK